MLKIQKLSRKWLSYNLIPMYCILCNQQKTFLKPTVGINGASFNLYGQPARDRMGEWRRSGKKLHLIVVSAGKFGRKVMVMLAVDIRTIWYYEILAENETMNVSATSVSLRDPWTAVPTIETSPQSNYLRTRLDLVATPQLLFELSKRTPRIGFNPFILPIQIYMIAGPSIFRKGRGW